MLSTTSRAQLLSVNTDVAMDAVQAYSFGLELTMGRRTTLNVNGLAGNKVLGQQIKGFAIQPEWRYYLSGRPMYHEFIGVVGLVTTYDMTYSGKVRDGHALGAGVSFGYVWPLPLPFTKRLMLDVHASCGVTMYKHKEYFVGDEFDMNFIDDVGTPIPNASGHLVMPMRVGVSLTYIIN